MITRLDRRATFAVALAAFALAAAPAAHAQGKWRAGTPIPQGANEVIGAEIDGQGLVYGGPDPRNHATCVLRKPRPPATGAAERPTTPVAAPHCCSPRSA